MLNFVYHVYRGINLPSPRRASPRRPRKCLCRHACHVRMDAGPGEVPTSESVRELLKSRGKAEQQRGLLLVKQLAAEEALELLLFSLETSSNEFIRSSAVISIGQLRFQVREAHEKALNSLVRYVYEDKDYSVRSAAAASIGYLSDLLPGEMTKVLDALTRATLEDTEWQVQFSCLSSLGNLGDRRAVPTLLSFLHSQNELLVQAAMGSLGEVGDPTVVPKLLEYVQNEDMMTRQRLALSLGLIKECSDNPAAIEALRKLCEDRAFAVRHAAQDALRKLGHADGLPSPADAGGRPDENKEVANLIRDRSAAAIPSQRVSHEEITRRLERSFDKEYSEDMSSRVGSGDVSDDPLSERISIDSEGTTPESSGCFDHSTDANKRYESLLEDLKHGDVIRQTLAAIELRTFDGELALKAVKSTNALDANTYPARVRSVGVSLAAKGRATDLIIETLRTDPEENVRSACCDALVEVAGGTEAVAACVEAFESDAKWLVRVSAAIALGSIGKGSELAENALIRSLRSDVREDSRSPQDIVIRRHAVTALGFMGSLSALPAFAQLVDDKNIDDAVRYRIAGALRGIRSEKSMQLLEKLVNDPLSHVAEMAKESLQHLAKSE